MGRKTNPNIIRIGSILRTWDAKWFAGPNEKFSTRLVQDLRIRRHIAKLLRTASVSRVEIARQPREVVLTIHTSRPAVVIGRGGSGIEKLQKELKQILGTQLQIRINVQEISNPDTDAAAIATQVVDQLERRMPFRRILKQALSRAMGAGARGVKVSVAGRLNGADIARREWLSEGNVPLHTFRSNISHAFRTAYTTFGTIGVKVWINRGELVVVGDEEKPGAPVKSNEQKNAAGKESLADKAARSKSISKNVSKKD